MYIKRTWKFKNSIEVEKIHTFTCRAKGMKRNAKINQTKESVKKNNKRKAVDRLRRLIKANFENGYHVVLTYDKDNRPDRIRAEKELKNFVRRMKYRFNKSGEEFKYILVTEYENKAIHHHLIINDSDQINVNRTMAEQWSRNGHVNYTMLYVDEEVETLAEYLIKETDKTFRDDECTKQRYTRSRNLIEPVCTQTILKGNTFQNNPSVPAVYALKKDTLINGVSDITGYPYQKYTLYKISNYRRRM